jgi:hypothetical protein
MTEESFRNYKISLEKDYGDLAYSILSKAKLGNFGGFENNIVRLKLLEAYIDIVLHYKLYASGGTNYSYFDYSEMQKIAQYINRLLKKTYNPDFLLTT